MKVVRFVLFAMFFSTFLFACSHPMHVGFSKYITEHPMELDKANARAGYTIDPDTMNMSYSFRSFMGGLANEWIVNVGPMLKDYLDTAGVNAFESLREDSSKSEPLHLHFKVNSYEFKDMRANVDMKVIASKGGSVVFEKDYKAEGRAQTGKMFWGGAAGMRHSVHQSTHYALNDIMNKVVADLK
jgi:hypothetical protein